MFQEVKLPPKSQKFNVICPFCGRKSAQRKALMEHIQLNHLEHLYCHLLGLDDDAVREFLDTKLLLTCEICRPKEIITFKTKSALNRHTKRFHKKQGKQLLSKDNALSKVNGRSKSGKSSLED